MEASSLSSSSPEYSEPASLPLSEYSPNEVLLSSSRFTSLLPLDVVSVKLSMPVPGPLTSLLKMFARLGSLMTSSFSSSSSNEGETQVSCVNVGRYG